MREGHDGITDKIGEVFGGSTGDIDTGYADHDGVTADDSPDSDIDDGAPEAPGGCLREPEDEDPTPRWGAEAPLTPDLRGLVNIGARAVNWAVDGRFNPDGKIHIDWNGSEDTDQKHEERAAAIRKQQQREQQREKGQTRFE